MQPTYRGPPPPCPVVFRRASWLIRFTWAPGEFPVMMHYVDWGPFWSDGHHTLIQGRTGSGKTTLLLNLLWMFHRRGNRILMRDDGGLDFLYLCREILIQGWVPRGCSFTCDEMEEVVHFTYSEEVLEDAYTDTLRFHAILYDC